MKLLILAMEYESAASELKGEENERLDHYSDRKNKKDDEDIEKKELGKIENFTVYLVNGEQVRDSTDIDWTTGGSSSRYEYIPEREVWIEDGMSPTDLLPTIIHEFVECFYMQRKGLNYGHAHDRANAYEIRIRDAIRHGKLRVRSQEQAFEAGKKLVERIIKSLDRKEK